MTEKQSWIFNKKWLSSALSIAYGPLFHGICIGYSKTQGDDFHPSQTSVLDLYLKLAAGGYFMNYYWLSMFEKVQGAKINNFVRASLGSGMNILGVVMQMPEYAKKGRKSFLESTNFLGEEEEWRTEAEYYLLNGKLGEAMDYITRYLEQRKEHRMTIDERIARPITRSIISAKARWRGNEQDVLEEALVDYFHNDKKRLFAHTWPRILKQYKTLEIQVIYAMFLSVCEQQEAEQAWQSITTNHLLENKALGSSRNEVYEINVKHFQEIIIVKKGKELKREWKILKEIEKQGGKGLTVMPLASYKEGENYVLITKRRKERTTAEEIQETTPTEEKERVLQRILDNLAQLHGLDITTTVYDPRAEIERRLFQRFPRSREEELFMQAYLHFQERRMETDLVLCHGDLYPTNVLKDGKLLDFESVQKASPWLDLETLLGAPQFQDIHEERVLEAYKERRPLLPGGRDFYKVHTSLCQIGSFLIKDLQTAQYFQRKAIYALDQSEEHELKRKFEAYLQPL